MSFFDKLKSKANDAMQSTNELIEIGKLNLEVKRTEDRMEAAFEDLGRAIYENYKAEADLDEELLDKCRLIDEGYVEIEKLNSQILKLKNKKKCVGCGHELLEEDVFCSKCGQRQVIDEEQREEVESNADEEAEADQI